MGVPKESSGGSLMSFYSVLEEVQDEGTGDVKSNLHEKSAGPPDPAEVSSPTTPQLKRRRKKDRFPVKPLVSINGTAPVVSSRVRAHSDEHEGELQFVKPRSTALRRSGIVMALNTEHPRIQRVESSMALRDKSSLSPTSPPAVGRSLEGGRASTPPLPLRPATTAQDTLPDLPSFESYRAAEDQPLEKLPTTDVVWRQTERERVYNFLLYVPYQLERVMLMGSLLCLDSFLGILTTLPWRCFSALKAVRSSTAGARSFQGSQLFDLLSLALLLLNVAAVRMINPGLVYYWMKDITSQFLKIQVVFSALEIFDKILGNFGVDVLEALSGTCTLVSSGTGSVWQLLSDFLIAACISGFHTVVLMCQALVFAVAMNSKKNALLALLIASNFVEIKGTVYKRMDTNKLWSLLCMDIVERFHLVVAMVFVMVEDMDSSSSWVPSTSTVWDCIQILLWEVVIDIIKHAVLGKFNDLRPGIYREYMRDLCVDILGKQSHNVHKLVTFHPLASAALFVRMALTLLFLRSDQAWTTGTRLLIAAGAWWVLSCLKPWFGYMLKVASHHYICYYNQNCGGKPVPRVIGAKKSGSKNE